MQRAFNSLTVKPDIVLIDGNKAPKLSVITKTIVKGDTFIKAISAASILAKVSRDRYMLELDREHPGYGFAKHKGYPTKQHIAALHNLGVSSVHRTTYAPVNAVINREKHGDLDAT